MTTTKISKEEVEALRQELKDVETEEKLVVEKTLLRINYGSVHF